MCPKECSFIHCIRLLLSNMLRGTVMCPKECSLIQYRFYLVDTCLEPLVRDANKYLSKMTEHGKHKVEAQRFREIFASLGEKWGYKPLLPEPIEDNCSAEHMIGVHYYHDIYILQLIANVNKCAEWEHLNQKLRFTEQTERGPGDEVQESGENEIPAPEAEAEPSTPNKVEREGRTSGEEGYIGEVLLFQGVYDGTSYSEDDVLRKCSDFARELGEDTFLLRWCRLDAGYLVQLSDKEFVLVSPEGSQEAVDRFAMQSFPLLMMYLLKIRFQKKQYDHLIAWMKGQESDSPPELSEVELTEWKRYYSIIPTLEVEANEAVAFVTENEVAVRTIGSKEAKELIERLGRLRLSYARLTKAVSDAEQMCDAIFINIENYLELIGRLKIDKDGGFVDSASRTMRITRESLSHEMSRHRAVVKRTQDVLTALNEHAQELRDLQVQEEARLQSLQTSLIAAIASLIGAGQLLASVPAMMQWNAWLKSLFLIFVSMGTLTLSHVVFNLKRANTWLDYCFTGTTFGIGLLTLYSWIVGYSSWADTARTLWPPSILTGLIFFCSGITYRTRSDTSS